MFGYKLERGKIPCLYKVSYRKLTKRNPPCIVLRLHEEFVKKNKNLVPLEFFIKQFQSEHNLGEFSPLGGKSFGFDDIIKKMRKDSHGFIAYKIEIPIFKKELAELCERCEGTGWDEDLDRDCLSCRGKKHQTSYDWRPFNAISASLHILSLYLETFDKQTSSKDYQLFTFQLACGKGMGHFPIWGHYGIDFCNWLNSLGKPHYQFDEVLKEMEEVYSYIYDGEEGWGFQAYVEEKAWLIISVPGDACGIHPTGSYSWESGKGREFSCHNMDNPGQQILILIALAILSDMTRKYMKG